MTVAETLAALKSEKDIEPSADYAGEENTDDFILAIQTDKTKQTKESAWIVCADHVKEHSGSLNASTTDEAFIRHRYRHHQDRHPAHPCCQRQPLRRRRVSGFCAEPQNQVRHR